MGFPKRLLADHESLVLDLRPHWIALAAPLVVAAAIVVAEVLVLRSIPDRWASWTRWGTAGAGVAFLLALPVRGLLAWLTSHFVVTTDRLIHRSGWLAKRSMEIPLERINDVSFSQTVFERVVGAGDLVIESAGEFGQNHFSDIRKPEAVQKTIFEMTEENQRRMTSPSEGDGGESPLDRIERLAALKERGAITEDEFEAQKRRLLGEA